MILIDPRHGSKREGQRQSHNIGPALGEMGIETEPLLMDSGDAFFLGNGPEGVIKIGIELKLVPDFVTSMISGRLAEQIEKLTSDYGRVYLIIEGFYRASRRNGMLEVPRGGGWRPLQCGRPVFWADIEKFITGLEEAGVRIRRTRTPHETAKVIAQVLYAFWQKEYDEHKSLGQFHQQEFFTLQREDEATRRFRRVLVALKSGIGVGRSKAVAQHFGSIYNAVTANAAAWAGIEGVGKKIAGDVIRVVREEIPQHTVQGTSARRVPQRRRAADGGSQAPRRRPHRQLAAGTATQRRVRASGRSRRESRGYQPKRSRK